LNASEDKADNDGEEGNALALSMEADAVSRSRSKFKRYKES